MKAKPSKNITIDVIKKRWIFDIELEDIIEPEALMPFLQTIKSYFQVPKVVLGVDVHLTYLKEDGLSQYALRYYDQAIIELIKQKARYMVLKNFKVRYENQKFYIMIDTDSSYVRRIFK